MLEKWNNLTKKQKWIFVLVVCCALFAIFEPDKKAHKAQQATQVTQETQASNFSTKENDLKETIKTSIVEMFPTAENIEINYDKGSSSYEISLAIKQDFDSLDLAKQAAYNNVVKFVNAKPAPLYSVNITMTSKNVNGYGSCLAGYTSNLYNADGKAHYFTIANGKIEEK